MFADLDDHVSDLVPIQIEVQLARLSEAVFLTEIKDSHLFLLHLLRPPNSEGPQAMSQQGLHLGDEGVTT
jgi:hypothetical protein